MYPIYNEEENVFNSLQVEPYNRTKCSLSSVYVKTTAFALALQEADSLCSFSNEDKLKTCVYTDDFAKAQPNSIKKDGHNTSAATKTKKHHKHKVPATPNDVFLEEMSALKKILSTGNSFNLQAYLQSKHKLGLTRKAVSLANLTNVQTTKKRRTKNLRFTSIWTHRIHKILSNLEDEKKIQIIRHHLKTNRCSKGERRFYLHVRCPMED